MSTLLQDLRYAVRMLAKSPGFLVVALLTLALGIGANTTLFSVVSAVLLRDLPFEQPDRVVQIWGDPDANGRGRNSVAGAEFIDLKEQNTVLESISAIRRSHLNLTGQARPERLRCFEVSASYLSIFRTPPLLGRGFLPDDDQPGKDRVALLTHSLWQRSFGGAPDVVGRTIRLGGEARVVIGILPPGPVYSGGFDVLIPFVFGSESWHQSRRDNRLRVVGRLKPGVSLAEARVQLQSIRKRLNHLYPEYKQSWSVAVIPLQEELTGAISGPLWILFGAVGLVLLIACANVAGLLLARNSARRKEIAMRTALGAGRGRIVRQLLTESVLLSIVGGVAGVILAYAGVRGLVRWAGDVLPRASEVALDGRVFAFALAVSLLTGLAFGLLPALQLGRRDLSAAIRENGRASAGRASHSLQGSLIAAELAIAMVLLVGSGLLLKTLARLAAVPTGFDAERVLAMDLSLDDRKYPDAGRRSTFVRDVLGRVESLPGVVAAGTATTLPLSGATDNFIYEESRGPDHGCGTDYDFVAGDYYRAMGVRLLRGRRFSEADDSPGAPPTAVINQALSRELFGDRDPIGTRVRGPFNGDRWTTVVGIVEDVRHRGLDRKAPPRIYLPQAFATSNFSLVVRTSVAPLSMGESVRRAILALDPDQPVARIRALEQDVRGSQARRRLLSTLLTVFAALAMVLAAVGLYGTMAFWMGQRTREIGIRVALGAGRAQVLRLLVGQGAKLVLAGLGLGLVGAFFLTRVLGHLLFEISPTDPPTFALTSMLLAGAALSACYVPARRAATLDPMAALRCE